MICALILWRSGLRLLMGKFHQFLIELSSARNMIMAGYYGFMFVFCQQFSVVCHGYIMMYPILTLALLNKLRKHPLWFLANQITWSRLLIQIYILNDKQCRSRSVAFSEASWSGPSQFGKAGHNTGSEGPGLNNNCSLKPEKINY